MDEPTLSYPSAPSGDVSPRQLAAAHTLRFWALMLIVFGLLLAVMLVDQYVIVRHEHMVLAAAGARFTRYDVYYTYSCAWKRLPYIIPLICGPAVMAGAYLVLVRRLQRYAADRGTLMLIMLLAMLHTLAAAACVLLFIYIGGIAATLAELTWRYIFAIAICLIAIAMVPGMFWTCIRFMDLLHSRIIPHPPIPAPPPSSPAAASSTDG